MSVCLCWPLWCNKLEAVKSAYAGQCDADAQAQHPDEPVHLVVLPNEDRSETDAETDSDAGLCIPRFSSWVP